MSTGLAKPVATLASVDPDSDIWAVFEDEVSDGCFPHNEEAGDHFAEDFEPSEEPPSRIPTHDIPKPHTHRGSPLFDRQAAESAVAAVDDLIPPRPPWTQEGQRKGKGWSRGSHRTSSSSSASRTALNGLLETMGIQPFQAGGSSTTSRTSVRSDELRPISRGSEKNPPSEMTLKGLSGSARGVLLLEASSQEKGKWYALAGIWAWR